MLIIIVLREMRTKTIMRYHFTATRIVIILKNGK